MLIQQRSMGRTVATYLITALLASGAVGCSQNVDIYFKSDERWEIVNEISYDPEELTFAIELLTELFAEEQFPVDSHVLGSMTEGGFEVALDLLATMYEQQGISAEWERIPRLGERAYRLKLQATGYDKLESVLPPGSTVIYDEKTNVLSISVYFGELAPWSSLLFKQQVSIHAARILEANTPHVERRRATWHNPSRVEATLKPQAEGNLNLLVLIAGLLCVTGLIVGGLIISRRRRQRQSDLLEFTEKW